LRYSPPISAWTPGFAALMVLSVSGIQVTDLSH
jgi:hypothetical protein